MTEDQAERLIAAIEHMTMYVAELTGCLAVQIAMDHVPEEGPPKEHWVSTINDAIDRASCWGG